MAHIAVLLSVLLLWSKLLSLIFAPARVMHERVNHITISFLLHDFVREGGDLRLEHRLADCANGRWALFFLESTFLWVWLCLLLSNEQSIVDGQADTRFIFLLNQRLNHRSALVADFGLEGRLVELFNDNSLHVLLPPMLMCYLILHKLVEVSRANLLLPNPDHHIRRVQLRFLLFLLPNHLRLFVPQLLLLALLSVKVESLHAVWDSLLNA